MTIHTADVIINASGLVKKFGEFTAVRGIDFQVRRGECFGLLGPNGAGKSSIVKMIYGFSPVTGGLLKVFGQDVATSGRSIKKRLGVVTQEDNLDPELTVLQNLLVYAGYFRMIKEEARQRALEVLDFMELKEKAQASVDSLSGGLKRRLTLGRALLNRPELLLLDEPTTGLDPFARLMVWQRLHRLKEEGATLLLTTHYLEEASKLCDRLVILDRGTILEDGSPQELIDRYTGREVLEISFKEESPYRKNPQLLVEKLTQTGHGLVKDTQSLGDTFLIFTNRGEEMAALVDRLTAKDWDTPGKQVDNLGTALVYRRLRPSTLEDVFLKLTGRSLEEAANSDGSGDGRDTTAYQESNPDNRENDAATNEANVWGDKH